MRLPLCIVAAALVAFAGWLALVPSGAESQAPAPNPVQTAPNPVQTVPFAKFHRAVSLYRREHKRAERASAEVRRIRQTPTIYSAADVRIAARLMAVLGGWPEQAALSVAWCESRHNPYAWNKQGLGGSNATGAWQVLVPGTWGSTDVGRAFPDGATNPYLNAAAALRVWQRNRGTFAEWADVCAR